MIQHDTMYLTVITWYTLQYFHHTIYHTWYHSTCCTIPHHMMHHTTSHDMPYHITWCTIPHHIIYHTTSHHIPYNYPMVPYSITWCTIQYFHHVIHHTTSHERYLRAFNVHFRRGCNGCSSRLSPHLPNLPTSIACGRKRSGQVVLQLCFHSGPLEAKDIFLEAFSLHCNSSISSKKVLENSAGRVSIGAELIFPRCFRVSFFVPSFFRSMLLFFFALLGSNKKSSKTSSRRCSRSSASSEKFPRWTSATTWETTSSATSMSRWGMSTPRQYDLTDHMGWLCWFTPSR